MLYLLISSRDNGFSLRADFLYRIGGGRHNGFLDASYNFFIIQESYVFFTKIEKIVVP